MLLRPAAVELVRILSLVGRAVAAAGLAMAAVACAGVLMAEPAHAARFAVGAGLALAAGGAAVRGAAGLRSRVLPRRPNPGTALAALAAAALIVPLFAAFPFATSGHWRSYLDAYVEATSGLTTSGLTLVTDLAHLPRSLALWRHALQAAGAAGLLFAVLSTEAAELTALGGTDLAHEQGVRFGLGARRVRRLLARVAVRWSAVGLPVLAIALLVAGMAPADAGWHAVLLLSSALSTGGFAPHPASAAAYHSAWVEAVLAVAMVAGAVSVVVHARLAEGREALRDLRASSETRVLAGSFLVLAAIAMVGLARSATFGSPLALARHGFFQLVSAHTTTGLATGGPRLLATDWGLLAPATLVAAVAVGGMATSAAGGIKGLRLVFVAKGLLGEVRRLLLPEQAELVTTYWAAGRRHLRTAQVRDAVVLLLAWLLLVVGTAIAAIAMGYHLDAALSEAAVAASSGGVALGVLRPGVEAPLGAWFAFVMIAGRLEVLALLALAGHMVASVRAR